MRALSSMVLLWLALFLGPLAATVQAQTNFAAAEVLPPNVWGSVTNDNSLVTPDNGAPSIAGFAANKPLWYSWTAPQSGEVELDTVGSVSDATTNLTPLDTVLAVFTGNSNSVSTLSQVAANDDLYPIFQENYLHFHTYSVAPNTPPVWIETTPPFLGGSVADTSGDYYSPYSGPSGLRFNAVGGQTYYFAVDSKVSPFNHLDFGSEVIYPTGIAGQLVLTWAYKSAGVFRFATEEFDHSGNLNLNANKVPLPLIQTAETETSRRWLGVVDAGLYDTTVNTYYTYNVPGVPVTITRVAGSSGRMLVNYFTQDGNPSLIVNGDQPALAGVDYTPVSGTLVFDDFEMSKTIYVPILDNGGSFNPHLNSDFMIVLTNATYDPGEDNSGDSSSVSPPRIDSNFGQVEVRILDADIDPKGPANSILLITNTVTTNVTTNVVWNLQPTNAVFNFMKANFRVTRDATNYWGQGTPITVYVTRTGTNIASASVTWIVDGTYLSQINPNNDDLFNLQPGSDYATPNPTNAGAINGNNSDFSFSSTGGTLSFGSGASAYNPQPIEFTVFDNGNPTLDKDLVLDLYQTDSQGNIIPAGMIAQCTVTILANRAPVTATTPNDGRIPAGSVDENYNIDFGLEMAPPINTPVQNNSEPGTDGEVDGLAVLANNETIVVGDFDSYNGISANGVCLVGTDGFLDQSFNSGSGVNIRDGLSVNCVAETPDNQHVVIGGSFTSYNGAQADGVARIGLTGQLDSTFSVGAGVQLNNGQSGTVSALAVQPNGQVIIGGNFNSVAGVPENYLARLNTDGSVDTNFNAGNTLNGPVTALAIQQPFLFATNILSQSGRIQENDVTVNVNNAAQGTVTVNYSFPTTNEMLVVYGGTVIFDTGQTATGGTPGQFSIPYGPGNTPILLVVNPGGGIPTGTNYDYAAVVSSASSTPEVIVGGNFNVSGQNYNDIALFNTNGALDTSFSPTTGADQPIYALDWAPNGEILVGGNFDNINTIPVNRFAAFNPDGSLDNTNFYEGLGADDTVFSINYQNAAAFRTNIFGGISNVTVRVANAIYLGGQFTSYNGTHRAGFARLYLDGTVDTSFMDSTYNQFAGLPKIYSYDAPAVHTSALQGDGNVIIGGFFDEVGGGQANKDTRDHIDQQLGITNSFGDPNQWLSFGGGVNGNVEPNSRDGVRNRSNLARLIGGATPGPGNLTMVPSTSAGYQANRNQITEPISLLRTNGFLGPETANFSIANGTAQNGVDLDYQAPEPIDWLAWQYVGAATRMHTDGLAGDSGFLNDIYGTAFSGGLIVLSEVNVTIFSDSLVAGNLTATYQLANPANADQLYLGGEDIAQGQALGVSSEPVSLIDNSQAAGTFGYASTTFIATNNAVISIIRQNGASGTISVNYSTNTPNGGTAIAGTDYVPISSTPTTFSGNNDLTNTFTISVLNHGVVYTNFTEKTINLRLTNLRPPGNGLAYGISNAVVRLINANVPGYLTLSTTNYVGLESPPFGTISFTVNRVSGNEGSLSVQYATANGTASNNVDYIGATNILTWTSGDVSTKTVTLDLINTGVVGTNRQFFVNLFNPQLNGSSYPALFYPGSPGSVTNATMVISNNNSYGSVQFSSTNYLINELGSFATLTVVRSGGVAGPAYVVYSTADGTALSNVNYTAKSGILTFAPNQLSASIQVAITNNSQAGPAPSGFYFNVKLSNPTNLTLGTFTNAQVNIVNPNSYNQPPGSPNTGFNADINGEVLSLAIQSSGYLVAGGSFTEVNGLPENNLVRLSTNGAVDTTFQAQANGTVQAVFDQYDDRLLVGGVFNSVDGVNLSYIARLMTDGSIDTSFNPGDGANGPIYAIVQTFVNGTPVIYAGGAFNTLNSVSSPGVARLNSNGTVDNTFNIGTGADGTVYAIAACPTNSVFAGDVVVGGSFVHYNGAVVNGLVRLLANGSQDLSFNPGTAATNGLVSALAIQADGRVVVGGSFTTFNGVVVNNIIRLNDDGSTDNSFTGSIGAGSTNAVDAIALQSDNDIIVGGQFAQAGGVTRNNITRLTPAGAEDPTINFGTGANGPVNALLIQPANGLITLGGSFTTYNSQSADHIAQIYGLSMSGSGAFEFSMSGYQVAENGIVAPVTIIRTGGTSGSVGVTFSTVSTNSSATASVNYFPVTTNLTFPTGEVLQTVDIPVLDDLNATTNSWVLNLGLFNPTPPAFLTNIPSATLTILNVNSAIYFTTAIPTVFENVPGSVANVSITRQGATNDSCSVEFMTVTNGSTGVPGTDYVPTNEIISFDPGQISASAQVLIISNSTLEKTVGLVLTNASNSLLFAPTNATLTIINNVGAPGEVYFASTNYTFNESSGNAVVTVLRTNGFSGTLTVGFTTVPGTAVPNVNYQTTSNSISFNPTVTSQTITVPLLHNGPPEGPVNFSIDLTSISGGATIIPPTNTTVNVIDDLNTGVSFVNSTNIFTETNGSVTIPIERLGNTNNAFSVHYFTTNGTAVAGVNYTTNGGILNFAAGQTLAGVSLTLLDNQDITNLQFGMVLTGPSASIQLGAPSNTVIILQPSADGVSFVSPTNSVFKNAGSITLPVVCYNPSGEPLIVSTSSVPLSVNFQTVSGTAEAGVDYTPVSGTLFFTNGIATNTITVPILNNSLITGMRTFAVNLFGAVPVPPAKLVSPSNEVVTVIDSNSGLAFSSANYSILNGGLATITVVRVDNTNAVSSVAYATTGGGTAVPGADYYPTNGVLTFSNGQTSATFAVTVITSTGSQPNKTILMSLSNPTGGVLMAPSAATLTIFNQNGSFVVPAGVSLFATNGAPGGILQSNQPVMLWFGFRDAGGTNVNDLRATLLSGGGVTSPGSTNGTATEDYGQLILSGASVSREFTFTPFGTNSQNLLASFALQDVAGGSTNNIGTNTFTLTIGSWTTTFSNTNAIIITAATNTGSPVIASPYPSIITVSNVGGVLIGTTVTLTNATLSSPQAVGALVVSPGQQDTLIMAGVGSQNVAASHVTLTFSDAATNSLPATTSQLAPITNGVYKPTQDGTIPNFP